MWLSTLLSQVETLDTRGNLNIEITSLHSDSRVVEPGGLFVAIQGTSLNGEDYIPQAIERGAAAVVLENEECLEKLSLPQDFPVVVVSNARIAVGRLACAFYGNPGEKLRLIGVTGTKGKTTTTFMIKAILEKTGFKVGLVGSIAAFAGDKKLAETDRTTPESIELQKLLAEMVAEGVEIAIIEVSSQAMKMYRTEGLSFEVAVFTNLSKDHISPKEHANMEEYFACKCLLMEKADQLVINADDGRVASVKERLPQKQGCTYGILRQADYQASIKHLRRDGAEFEVNGESVWVSIPGKFSVYNALAAMTASSFFGASMEQVKDTLSDITVLGRSELVPNPLGISIMIDYAHTPASLESILQAVRGYVTGKVICAWGVGGDRDREKRPIMGEISGRLADYTVLMSDQVRTEDPMQILKDIEVGIIPTGKPYEIVVDRTEGIKKAISMANPGDMVLIPGLGHDKYLERNGVKYPYDEREVIAKITTELSQSKR